MQLRSTRQFRQPKSVPLLLQPNHSWRQTQVPLDFHTNPMQINLMFYIQRGYHRFAIAYIYSMLDPMRKCMNVVPGPISWNINCDYVMLIIIVTCEWVFGNINLIFLYCDNLALFRSLLSVFSYLYLCALKSKFQELFICFVRALFFSMSSKSSNHST